MVSGHVAEVVDRLHVLGRPDAGRDELVLEERDRGCRRPCAAASPGARSAAPASSRGPWSGPRGPSTSVPGPGAEAPGPQVRSSASSLPVVWLGVVRWASVLRLVRLGAIRWLLARQAEHPLGDDVALDLRRPPGDGAGEALQPVHQPGLVLAAGPPTAPRGATCRDPWRPSASPTSRARPRRSSLPRSLSTECSGEAHALGELGEPPVAEQLEGLGLHVGARHGGAERGVVGQAPAPGKRRGGGRRRRARGSSRCRWPR